MRTSPKTRIQSWEHCMNQFANIFVDLNENKKKIVTDMCIDNLSLHLGFFLASWGMMRGSTDLLEYDYKVHIPVVRILLKYSHLFRLDFLDQRSETDWEDLKNLSDGVKSAYSFENVTDTLVTKILMGTLGIVPAYDDFVKTAVKHYGITTANFNIKSFKKFAEYFSNHFVSEIAEYTKVMQGYCPIYTRTKIIDVLLWVLGKKIAKQKEEEKKKIQGEN